MQALLALISLISLWQVEALSVSYGKQWLSSRQTALVQTKNPLNSTTRLFAIAKDEGVSKKKIELNAIDLCLCGAFATALGDFIMHPIDTIKITQQTAGVAKSMLGTAQAILASKGLFGLYQGVVPYLIGDGLSGAVKFATFELTRRYTERRLAMKYHGIGRFLCAAFAMFACSIVLVPAEVLKTRLQAGAVSSLSGAITSILKTEGIRGLFAGYYATLVRDIPYTMLELGIYENLKVLLQRLRKTSSNDNSAANVNDELFAAALTGGVTAFFTTPLDLIKTKLMMQATTGGKYAGVLDALTSIYLEGGLSALFVGSAARVAWLLPFTTIYLGLYEKCKRALLNWKIGPEDSSIAVQQQ